MPEWIGTDEADNIIILGELGQILSVDGKTSEKQTIGKVKGGSYSGRTNCNYVDPYLFYDNDNYELYRVDTTNGSQQKIIGLTSMNGEIGQCAKTGSLTSSMYYCKDYIAIETSYENRSETKEYKSLLIFDYKGTLISKNKL